MQKTEITIGVIGKHLWLHLKFDSERTKRFLSKITSYLIENSGNSNSLKIIQIDQFSNENLKAIIHLEIPPEIYLSCETSLHKNLLILRN